MTADTEPRQPRAFKIGDPAIGAEDETIASDVPPGSAPASKTAATGRGLTTGDLKRGARWGGLFFSAMAALASLAAGLWFARFVAVALNRQDWVGWTAFGLLMLMAVSALALIVRELWGFRSLARLARLRKNVREAIASGDRAREKSAVVALAAHYRGRPDAAWGLERLQEHKGDVLEPGELIRLADRELVAPLDEEARRIVLKTSKRVATVTALLPIMWITMAYVAVANIRMFRALASLYGGRPGTLGALRLARLIVGHIVATGGVAMTDDLLGQFLGQDVLRRLSRRLGEGAFNGALTARLGVAAIEVTRPLPFLDAPPVRVREIFAELFRTLRQGEPEARAKD
jgi:putative membrane protein